MNVILDSINVVRMQIVPTMKEALLAHVKNPFLVMARNAMVITDIYDDIIVYNQYLHVEGFRPVILVVTATTPGNVVNSIISMQISIISIPIIIVPSVVPNHQFLIYSIGRNFCLEKNNTIPHEVLIDCPLERKPFPSPRFSMSMMRMFRNGTVEALLNTQAENLSLHPSQFDSLFEEDTAIIRITCNVSNSFGSDHETTDIRKCGMYY